MLILVIMLVNEKRYRQASLETAEALRSIASSPKLQALSTLSLPEIDSAVDIVSRIVPAGNVPAMILSGLARLPNRRPPTENIKRDINLLFRGVETALDKAVYGAFFAGPAAVIWGYQNLLKLAGKTVEASFPEGLWQFYTDYALREDTARFTIETHGFDTILNHHQVNLSPVNRVVAWAMAAIHCLHQYNALLTNEWRERIYSHILQEIINDTEQAPQFARIYTTWEQQRPFGRQQDTNPQETYPNYRHRKFDAYLHHILDQLDPTKRYEWSQRIQAAKTQLPAYQQQMSILAYLKPTTYGETRQLIPLPLAQIALIHRGHYYLIPASHPGRRTPPTVEEVQAWVTAVIYQPVEAANHLLLQMASLARQEWFHLHPNLNATLRRSLEKLRRAPIILNIDQQSPRSPLSELRQAERGIGDHPLTIFDTQKTFVFDHSHIFFDGTWAASLAEILTREALAWAVYLQQYQGAYNTQDPQLKPLPLPFERRETEFLQQAKKATPEVSAETDTVQIKAILSLRKMFKRRSDLLQLTVNDLLVLYRAIHAATYQPSPKLMASLETLSQDPQLKTATSQALQAITTAEPNPAILIPIDASRKSPKERLYPLVFTVPLTELNIIDLHTQTVAAWQAYQDAQPSQRMETYTIFDQQQRQYLATLAGLGQVLTKAKTIAGQGEGSSQGAIKLLAHMPTPLQRLLDQIPNRFDVLNDLIKGREVFSNVGAAAPNSSLSRFNTAKDDNKKKTLAWGVLTDANGIMHVSLRDFRPHVAALIAANQQTLAQEITQHYLDSYAQSLNKYVQDLARITRTSRETQIISPPTEVRG